MSQNCHLIIAVIGYNTIVLLDNRIVLSIIMIRNFKYPEHSPVELVRFKIVTPITSNTSQDGAIIEPQSLPKIGVQIFIRNKKGEKGLLENIYKDIMEKLKTSDFPKNPETNEPVEFSGGVYGRDKVPGVAGEWWGQRLVTDIGSYSLEPTVSNMEKFSKIVIETLQKSEMVKANPQITDTNIKEVAKEYLNAMMEFRKSAETRGTFLKHITNHYLPGYGTALNYVSRKAYPYLEYEEELKQVINGKRNSLPCMPDIESKHFGR